MKVEAVSPRQFLRPLLRKSTVQSRALDSFGAELEKLQAAIVPGELEEFHKEPIAAFLRHTHYPENDYAINTKDRIDLVIADRSSGAAKVLFETKRPAGNTNEMCRIDRMNVKALHELLWYFMQERHNGNLSMTHLVVTNVYEWFVFDARLFDTLFYQDRDFCRTFEDFCSGSLLQEKTDTFYRDIAQPAIEKVRDKLRFCYFDLRLYDTKNQAKLVALYKLFSPEQLLKLEVANDSNSLNKDFYTELLHILGLEETKVKGKKLIQRCIEERRLDGSLIENTIEQLKAHNKIITLPEREQYGDTHQEQLFNVALELVITWVNRLLFLKLLEAQLLQYHGHDPAYAFLGVDQICDYDEVDKLFFRVLARKPEERSPSIRPAFARVPYLNSSLFEPTDLEQKTLFVSNLENHLLLPVHKKTKLREANKQRSGKLDALHYFLSFLGAYDFGAENVEEVRESKRTLINASVLGLIFEKINGYRDGSFFTPGYITEYMARQTIEQAVLQKFNQSQGWECGNITPDLYNRLDGMSKERANQIFDSIRICDPAVGSGHFLVSALNVLLAIKQELKILVDDQGRLLRGYRFLVENDELVVLDEEGHLFQYKPGNAESQSVQKTLFQEKKTLIENCLFGVDINPNSVKICRLRLWIELLKNTYYNDEGPLETLPNIDINIRCGNSLVQRAALAGDLQKALLRSKWNMEGYRQLLAAYRGADDKSQKMDIVREINSIRENIRTELAQNHPLQRKREKLSIALNNALNQGDFLVKQEERQKEIDELTAKLGEVEDAIQKYQANVIFQKAFEWRFEFPEVLDDKGDFVGFDVVIGNPPYIRQEELKEFKEYFAANFGTYAGTADLYVYFVEQGLRLLRDDGYFCYILPNKWMRAGYGKKLRLKLQQTRVISMYDFGDLPVFEEATTYPCIMTLQKSSPAQRFVAGQIATLDFEDDLAGYIRGHSFGIEQTAIREDGLTLSSPRIKALLDKIVAAGTPLGEVVGGKLYRGVLTGLNEAFVIDAVTRDRLIAEDPASAEVIKPFLAGRDIKRYGKPVADKWLILFPCGWTDSMFDGSSEAALWQQLSAKYPAICRHLECHEDKARARYDKGRYWWELRACDYYEEFEKPKIILPDIAIQSEATYDVSSQYTANTGYIIPTQHITLLGILNAKVTLFFYSHLSPSIRGGYYRFIRQYLEQIPVPSSWDSSDDLKALVEAALNAKTADRPVLEQQIDQIVYQMYGLTDEEIAIVEGVVG